MNDFSHITRALLLAVAQILLFVLVGTLTGCGDTAAHGLAASYVCSLDGARTLETAGSTESSDVSATATLDPRGELWLDESNELVLGPYPSDDPLEWSVYATSPGRTVTASRVRFEPHTAILTVLLVETYEGTTESLSLAGSCISAEGP